MRNPFQTPLVAVFQNEVRLNSRRVAPYALMIFFSSNAVLWSVGGAPVSYGWAINSDFSIVRNFGGFAIGILGLPLFAAVIMADPVIRDFRLGIDPLIFSKPVSRAQYLLGKFFGSFLVLVCCQAAFALTLVFFQVVHTSRMVVLPFRVVPYIKHFFLLVVISYLLFAAIYFAVGTLTRNAKIVYGLAVAYYPLYIAYGLLFLKDLPRRWRTALDPMLSGISGGREVNWEDAEAINRIVISYSSDMFANRLGVILIAAMVLTVLYFRFTIAERPVNVEKLSLLNLSTAAEGVYYDSGSLLAPRGDESEADYSEIEGLRSITLPEVATANEGMRATVNKLVAAVGVEFRLLRAERSLVVMMPLAIFISILEVAFYAVTPEVSYSAAYAANTAKLLLLFLFGMTVFFTSEAMHRDRELRIEPVLWSMPTPNNVLLLSKFLATLFITVSLIVLVGLTAIVIQFLRGHTPVDVVAYIVTYSVILIPTIIFMTAASMALNVLLRDKYVVYAVSIATGAGLVYLYNLGYNHWLYNPAQYQLWTYSDLIGTGSGQGRILAQRIYWVTLSCLCVAVAHLGFHRKSAKGFRISGRLSSTGWTLVLTAVSILVAVVTGLMVK